MNLQDAEIRLRLRCDHVRRPARLLSTLLVLVLPILLILSSCTKPSDLVEDPFPLPTPTGSWETLTNAPVALNRKHDDLFFVNERIGWVVTRNGFIFKTLNGGEHWTPQYSGPQFFRAVGFADSLRGWAANLQGDDGDVLYRTTNGGTVWTLVTNIPEPSPPGICGISVVDTQTVFMAGRLQGPAIIIKSLDGGANWQSIDMREKAGMLIDIYFRSKTEGIVIGGTSSSLESSRMLLLQTSDGGLSWETRFTGTRVGEWGWKISFPTQDIGYVSIQTSPSDRSAQEYFLKTVNGGMSWSEVRFSTTHYSSQGIGFIAPEVGWMGSYHPEIPTLKTTDGGTSWKEDGYGTMNRFRFLDGKIGYASGSTVFKIVLE